MADQVNRRRFLTTVTGAAAGALAGPTGAIRPARAQSRTKVAFAWPFAPTSQAFQEELARRFMDAHKSIEVEVQVIPQTQAVPKLTAAFTGGAAPDCLALSHQRLTQFAGGGYLENLEPHLKASGLDRDLAAPLMAEARVVGNMAHSAASWPTRTSCTAVRRSCGRPERPSRLGRLTTSRRSPAR